MDALDDNSDDEIGVVTLNGGGGGHTNVTKTTIKKYEKLKVYEVDARDNHMKKYTSKTTHRQGRLKIYLNEQLNEIFFVIYAVNSFDKLVFDHLSLNEIDCELVKVNLSLMGGGGGGEGGARQKKKRIEFKKKKLDPEKRFYHAVEFSNEEGLDDLSKTFEYLNEAYNTTNYSNNRSDSPFSVDDYNVAAIMDMDSMTGQVVNVETPPKIDVIVEDEVDKGGLFSFYFRLFNYR
jgi:hypothetical protein